MIDFNDKSQYRSAQGYNDNIICICFESSYKFYHKVFSEVKAMYDEVNIKMEKFSIGADEVPFGAWKKSKVCQEKYGIDFNVNDLYLSNLKRLLTMIKERGVTMTGWEDILLVQSSQSQMKNKDQNILIMNRFHMFGIIHGGRVEGHDI